MKIIIEAPKDQFQQFMAWIDEQQPAGDLSFNLDFDNYIFPEQR